MYVEIAEVDRSGIRGTVHEFGGVVGINHEEDAVYLSMENGNETLKGGRFDIVTVEQE